MEKHNKLKRPKKKKIIEIEKNPCTIFCFMKIGSIYVPFIDNAVKVYFSMSSQNEELMHPLGGCVCACSQFILFYIVIIMLNRCKLLEHRS